LVSTKLNQDDGLVGLPPFIAQMVNLQDLRLETPDCNKMDPLSRIGWVSLQDRYERVFAASCNLVPKKVAKCLPNLKTVTLHFVDSAKEIYSMIKYSTLFLHPNLRSLTISCASTDWPKNHWNQFKNDPVLVKSTMLQHLHLEESDILPETLAIILSFPKELKSLTISEGVRYDHFSGQSSRIHGDVCPAALIEAIEQNCDKSLESLSLNLGHWRSAHDHIDRRGQHLDLTRFDNLKSLELNLQTLSLIRTRPHCDHATWRRVPPNLQKLTVTGMPMGHSAPFLALRRTFFPLDPCTIIDKDKHGLAKLNHLVCRYEYCSKDDRVSSEPSSDEEYDNDEDRPSQVAVAKAGILRDFTRIQHVYRKAGIRVEAEVTMLPDGFIPPYLFPEDQPLTTTVWQSW
jgi:hypothetical protein